MAEPAVVRLPNILLEFRHWLQREAGRGVEVDRREQVQSEIASWSERTSATGLTAFRRLVSPAKAASALVLQANYVRLQYMRLMGAPADAEPATST